jgi:predicted Zn-ribbon and HTH transcriptional regulator
MTTHPNSAGVRLIPVVFVLDENNEANGTIRYYCSDYCREKALQTNEDPISKGEEHPDDVIETTQCENCGQPVESLETCEWTCPDCKHVNIEYDPFPIDAICAGCGRNEANYCTHPNVDHSIGKAAK